MSDSDDDIDAQIAALEAKKAAKVAKAARERAKQEAEERRILIGSTPTQGSLSGGFRAESSR